jgi:hypothetical protein
MSSEALMPATAEPPSNSQRLFVSLLHRDPHRPAGPEPVRRVFEIRDIDSFTTSLLCAIVLQILLK